MSGMTLTLRARPRECVDMAPLTPDRLAGLTEAAVAKLRLQVGNGQLRVDDLFRIDGACDGHLRITRSIAQLNGIGAGLREGAIEVRGQAGAGLGREMRGGSIHVRGDVGTWAGAGMRGGSLVVTGNAGDFLGAALPGEMEGMSGGTIHVYGNVGARVGDRQRRGLIIIEGDAGDFCGSRMLAGTIMVLGAAGRYVGAGMHRGTIVLRQRPKLIGATFNSCGTLKMEILRVLFRRLGRSNRRLATLEPLGPLAERYAGDLALGGKGELLLLRPAR